MLAGSFFVWLYKNTGFAKILSDLEIIWASIIASFAWWFKVLYEKWDSDRKSLAKLQRIMALNFNTLLGIEKFITDWSESIDKQGSYTTYVEEFEIPSDEIVSRLRNLTVLNSVVPWLLKLKRYNNDITHLWQHYAISRDEIFKSVDVEKNLKKINALTPILKEIIETIESDREEFFKTIAILRVAGEKTNDSLFRKLTLLTTYSLTESEIDSEIYLLRAEAKKKKLT